MIDPITAAAMLRLGFLVVKAIEGGVSIGARVDYLVGRARNEGRNISDAELDALEVQTNELRDKRKAALASAGGVGSPAPE